MMKYVTKSLIACFTGACLLFPSPAGAGPAPGGNASHDPAAVPAPAPRKHPLRVNFIDVGAGDSCLIQCPGGENILIDGGSGYGWDSGADDPVVNNYLRSRGVTALDMIISTHPHSDHVGGLASVIREFPVKTVIESGKTHTTNSYRRFLEAVKARPNIKFKTARAGQEYSFGDVKLRILHPGSSLPKKINNCSIVCRLTYGKASFLFAGDAEEPAEREIIRRGYRLRSTVLKVGHHGNESSSSAPFIRAVSPKVAVISCGERKSLMSGDSKVLERLRNVKASVYRTDRDGTVVVESDGERCGVKLVK